MESMTEYKNDVEFSIARVKFNAFEAYKSQAEEIAAYINSIAVTEDNVKGVKKDLAAARKVTDGLNRKRIDMKKVVLSEFTEFENQVKQLASIIDDADQSLRQKVRELEELERDQKREKILELWNQRAPQYMIFDYLPNAFDRWLTPQHLNKTTSMKSVETDMTEWLEEREHDIEFLKSKDDEYLVDYLDCLDLRAAMAAVDMRHEIRDEINSVDEINEELPTATFTVYGAEDIETAEKLLNKYNIIFKRG